ncbi:MAG: patatin-like phospholipase family protein [Acidobacteriota bacterium]|jgi:predicted acylesterase/phospholipase RssA
MADDSGGLAVRSKQTGTPTGSRVGLALAGGGPQGAVYEIGALRALDEVLEGVDFNRLHVYVGVSAGSFIASTLVNGIDTAQLCRAIVSHEPGEHPFTPETFLTPSGMEWLRRSASVPRHFLEGLFDYLRHPLDNSLAGSLTRMGRALPVGVCESQPIHDYLERVFEKEGRTNDFRELDTRLYVVATDLDSGKAVRFGEKGLDHVPLAKAVQASVALPGLYPPVEIEGRFYVDGVLKKTLHASVALDAGADLLLCVNPIVPVDTVRAVERGVMRRGKLIDRGLPSVLSQTFRTLINSRLEVGLRAYEERYAGRDWVLFQPRRDDYRMFFTNIFSFQQRVAVCEHAYRQTRHDLRERYRDLAPLLERHGVTIRKDVLFEKERDLWRHAGLEPRESGLDLTRRGRREAPPRPARSPGWGPAWKGNGSSAWSSTRRLSETLDRLERRLARFGEAG